MKRIILFFSIFTLAFSLYAKGIQDDVNLLDETKKTSYALGMVLGTELSTAGLEVDYITFAESFMAAMEDRQLKYTPSEAVEIVETAFAAAQELRNEENKVKEIFFLEENAKRDEVHITDSGLQYEILIEGEGESPAANDIVKVLYEGSLLDGTIFDSSDDIEVPAEFPLDAVIPGWSEGLQLMKKGSKYRLFIPSEMAYGIYGAGEVIPPYSTLIFTVELLDFSKPETSPEDAPAVLQE
jgi:FKBP-type peptidyl-prolyl cis-trans isomerase FkpA